MMCFALVFAAGIGYGQQSVDDVITQLRGIAWNMPVRDWRFTSSDAAGAYASDFDDSAWNTASPEFDYGAVPVAWIRKTITIPEKIGRYPVKGSKVTFLAGIDDDGECYVNGELKQEFHWDGCRVVLTESAPPGERFVIALKASNGPGSGRLFFAELEFGLFDDIRAQVGQLASDLEASKRLADREDRIEVQDSYRKSIAKAVTALDLSALERADKRAFTASVSAAEKELEPISRALKDYTVHLIGHAHIDMNWLWLWPETVDVCRNTFRTVTSLLAEYPEFRFSQSQASTYLAVEEADPALFAKIKEWVKTGRWEITGGTWVEGDMNMASGESIVRQILYAKRYFKDKFGIEPVMCWEPDTFGHAWTIPQILAKSGLKYYYFCRCGRDEPVFWWEAPDGSRVLAYNRGWYNESVKDDIMDAPLDIAKRHGVKEGMVVYGVGDHGGGPTRKDLDKALALQKSDVYVNVKFDTTTDFYEGLLAQKKDWPVIRDELNFIFRGCYTSHSDIKKMNRELENLLPTAELFSALAGPYGFVYPSKGFVDAWRNACFNQFHDIFDGTSIHGAYAYSREVFRKAHGVGSTALAGSLDMLSDNVDTNGQGMPVIVFNPMSWKRTDVVRIKAPSDLKHVSVREAAGREMPADIVEGQLVFTAKDVPSVGYKVFYLIDSPPVINAGEGTTIENEFFRIDIDPQTGAISRVYDKKAGREVLAPGKKGDQLQVLFEDGASAWNIGGITRTENIETPVSIEKIADGPTSIIRVMHKFGSSRFSQDIILHEGVPRIDFKLTADWYERNGPMLKVAFPLNIQDGTARFEIPFGSIERPANGNEVPGQKWIDLSNANYGVSLLNDCKYGHDVNDNVIRLTLLRSSNHPDPIPDAGRHEITYSLYPHTGDWIQANSVRRGYELNNPLIPIIAEKHAGRLPKEYSFLEVAPSNMIVTALKKAEDSDDLILRFYDCTGSGGKAIIKLGFEAAGIRETDLMERPMEVSMPVTNGRVGVPVGKWQIKTFRIEGVSR